MGIHVKPMDTLNIVLSTAMSTPLTNGSNHVDGALSHRIDAAIAISTWENGITTWPNRSNDIV